MPNDHARTIIELLRPAAGSSLDLARRWLAALLLVPEHERQALVEAVEARITQAYGGSGTLSAVDNDPRPVVFIKSPPSQRDGYVEHVERAYAPAPTPTRQGRAGRAAR